jgi:L-ascorbate metabolism protein UlaG (beta-lactamase superfamily)
VQFGKNLSVELRPNLDANHVPAWRILNQWTRAKFETNACREALERLIDKGLFLPDQIRPGMIDDGGLVLADKLLFHEVGPWELVLGSIAQNRQLRTALETPAELQAVSKLLRWAFRTGDRQALRERFSGVAGDLLDDVLSGAEAPGQELPPPTRPGIYRREHASLAIRSRTTSLVIDPITLQRAFPSIANISTRGWGDQWDAILVTHSHGDHWHVPSLLFNAVDPATPVIVPFVPKPNLLTPEDFRRSLDGVGQTAIAARWGETVTIGDIEIDILPFYGEQPTRDSPGPAEGLRSWGNCYRFNTPDFSAIVLVDSGIDPMGSMLDVMAESRRRRGPADVVLSCLRQFASPFFGGLSHYWTTLPFSRLQALYAEYAAGTLPFTTAGPDGVAAACEAAGARYFLPYAHGFEALGKPVTDIGWSDGQEPSEAEICGRLEAEIRSRKGRTEVRSWEPGDLACLDRSGELGISPYSTLTGSR